MNHLIFEGERLKIVDACVERDSSSADALFICRGAFGSGEHETTRMCLRLLEEYASSGFLAWGNGSATNLPTHCTALDLGTGTGILALAAISLGCGRVLAVDPSEEAIETTKRNIALNGMDGRVVPLLGELKDVPSGSRFRLIMANLYGFLLDALVPKLCTMLEPGGAMVLSGMLYGEDFSICRQAERQGVVVEKRLGGEEYLALGLRKES
jgi:ribosomal protein L11 methyltransferase